MTDETTTNTNNTQGCPYLDTINRTSLDFDFEPTCSITLSSGTHIYCCLVCGKNFRGKGKQSPAYIHAINENHYVYIHLTHGTFWCLPDNYQIFDSSLNDIKEALQPTFSKDEMSNLDKQTVLSRDLFGKRYLPGFVGLNNLKKTDGYNATLQALAHVKPLRAFFLACSEYNDYSSSVADGNGDANKNTSFHDASSSSGFIMNLKVPSKKRKHSGTTKIMKTKQVFINPKNFTPIVKSFGEMIRKMWSNKRFKSTVDPHLFIQAIYTTAANNDKFVIGKQCEVSDFICWLLHQLHIGIMKATTVVDSKGNKKKGENVVVGKSASISSSIIHEIFQGAVEIMTCQPKSTDKNQSSNELLNDDRLGSDDEQEEKAKEESLQSQLEVEEIITTTNFLQLTLDIPEKPLFKDDKGGLVIPQEPLFNLLKKFDGMSFHDVIASQNAGVSMKRRYRLKRLPNYLIICLSRFQKNNFNIEKNPTIVPFPVKNLDLSHYVYDDEKDKKRDGIPTEHEIREMDIKQLKDLLEKHGRLDLMQNIVEKGELVTLCLDFFKRNLSQVLSYKYDLVANITHTVPSEVGREGAFNPLEEGEYRCHVQHEATKQWYEMQDLHVQEIMPQLIGLSESYVLIFEKKNHRVIY